jgi:hypothetical protein
MANVKIYHKSRAEHIAEHQLRAFVRNTMDQLTIGSGAIERAFAGCLQGINWKSSESEDMLEQRERLALYVRKGMLERKNMEEEIIILACLIYTNRIYQQAEKDRILGLL